VYEPELARYGGQHGVAVSEQLFHASSQYVLSVVPKQGDRWQSRLTHAIAMAVCLARAFGLPRELIRSFGLAYAKSHERFWRLDDLLGDHKEFDARTMTGAESLRDLIDDLTNDSWDSGGEPLSLLHAASTRCVGLLRRLAQSGELALPRNVDFVSHLLPSYWHMSFNRLGCSQLDEALVASIIGQERGRVG
jgi:thiopeptide-type bacteriocin biosynthesis protein